MMYYEETTIEDMLMANYEGITTIDDMFEVFGEENVKSNFKEFIFRVN